MSIYRHLNSRLLLKSLSFCALLAFTLSLVPHAEAQLPAVLSYGSRLAIVPNATTGNVTKVARDAAGDIFFLTATPAVWEIPVNGPVQIVVPSTDAAFTTLGAGDTMAVDPAGNIYLMRTNNNNVGGIIKIPRNANGTYNYAGETQNTTLSSSALTLGFYQSVDLAVDGSGNMYVTSKSGSTVGAWQGVGILEVGPAAPSGKYFLISTVAPKYINMDTAGDLFYADGTNAWEITAANIASGSTIAPIQIGTTTSLPSALYVYLDQSSNLYVANGTTLYLVPNTGSFSSSSTVLTFPNTFLRSVSFGAVDNNGDIYAPYSSALEFYGSGKYYQPNPSVDTGTLAVGAASGTGYANPSILYLFTQAVTTGTPYDAEISYGSAYGAAGAQQSIPGGTGTTCAAATTYAANSSCYIELGYHYYYPGAASGGLALYGCPSTAGTCNSGYSSTGVLSTTVGTAVVTGAELALDSVVASQIGTGYASPSGFAMDNTGAVYLADASANAVTRFPSGSTSSTAGTAIVPSSATVTGFNAPSGVAIDQGGNLYVADSGNNRIVVIPNSQSGLVYASAYALATTGYTLSFPHGVAVDSYGNIFISDTGNARILEVPNPYAASAGATPTVITSSLTAPYGIGFDAYNNLFIADKGANAVYETPTGNLVLSSVTPTSSVSSAGSGTLTAVGTGLSAPTGVAADASGSVYIADGGNSRIVKVPAISGVVTTASQSVLYSGLNKPYGVAIDLTGDLYYTDSNAPGLFFALRSSPASGKTGFLNFGSVAVNSTTNLTATISNVGLTTSLAISAIAAPASPVSLGSASTNPCSSTPTLTPGTGCNLLLIYNPTTTGATSAFFNLTDNALNATAANQGIHYEGNVSGAVASVTLTGPTSVAYGDTATYTLTALDSSGNPAVAGNGTYTVNITGTATKTAAVTLTGGTGTFFLPGVGVGSYNLATTVSGFPASVAVTVTKAPLSVIATSFTRIFDQANPAPGYTYSGFVNGDTAASLTGTAPTVSTTATRVSNAGSYPVTLSGSTLASPNYTITLVNGTATVGGAAPQTILFPALPPYTHGTSVTLTGQATSGLPLTYAVTAGSATISGAVLTITAAGTVTVQASQAGNSNYTAAPAVVRSFTAQ